MLIEPLAVSHFGEKPVYVPFHCSWYCNQHASGGRQPATEVWEREAQRWGGREAAQTGDWSCLIYRTWHSGAEYSDRGSQRCEGVVWYSRSQPTAGWSIMDIQVNETYLRVCVCVVMLTNAHIHLTLYLLWCICSCYNRMHRLPHGLLIKDCVARFSRVCVCVRACVCARVCNEVIFWQAARASCCSSWGAGASVLILL